MTNEADLALGARRPRVVQSVHEAGPSSTALSSNLEEEDTMIKSMALVLLGAMAACAATPSPVGHVQTDTSATGAFADFHTFAFRLASNPPSPFQVSARSFEVEKRMRPLVVAELASKGYVEQLGPTKPDFMISFASGYATEVPYQGQGPASTGVEKGSIVIDAFDAASESQVWHGTGEARVDPEKIDDQLLRTAVQRVLASFPSRTPEGNPGVTSAQTP